MPFGMMKPGRECVLVKWGLIPSWAADPKIGYKLINARSETAATKPSFRAAFKRRRCLIPADGFYEWKGTGKKKQPYLIGVGSDQPGEPFAFAGLWETWLHDGKTLECLYHPDHRCQRSPSRIARADAGHPSPAGLCPLA